MRVEESSVSTFLMQNSIIADVNNSACPDARTWRAPRDDGEATSEDLQRAPPEDIKHDCFEERAILYTK